MERENLDQKSFQQKLNENIFFPIKELCRINKIQKNTWNFYWTRKSQEIHRNSINTRWKFLFSYTILIFSLFLRKYVKKKFAEAANNNNILWRAFEFFVCLWSALLIKVVFDYNFMKHDIKHVLLFIWKDWKLIISIITF